MIRIRVDDFPNTKDWEKDKHSLVAYREFHKCLSECIGGKRYLLGVIPGRCSVDDVLFLRNETDVVVGMHGIYHDEKLLDLYQNEFPPYLSQNEIGRKLLEASHALEVGLGREVRIYMPPRNRIDQRMVSVLLDCGFFGYTTGPETDPTLEPGDLMAIGSTPHSICYGRTDELLRDNAHIRLTAGCEQGAGFNLTLHWTWETNIGLDHMRRFFAQIPAKYFEDFD